MFDHLLGKVGDRMHVEHVLAVRVTLPILGAISVADHEYFALLVGLLALLQHDDEVELAVEERLVVLPHHVLVLPLRSLGLLLLQGVVFPGWLLLEVVQHCH
jgi:hypothetical protein